MKSDLMSQFANIIETAKREAVQDFIRGLGAPDAPKARKPRKVVAKAAPAKAPKAKAAKPAAPRGVKRASEALEALVGTLLAHIQRNPGESMEAIGKALGVKTKELALPVKKLLKDVKIRVEGQKRATKYFAVEKAKSNGVTRMTMPVVEEASAE